MQEESDESKVEYVLEDVNPAFLSSDVFTPCSLPRCTQPSVGKHLTKKKEVKDLTYGTHHSEYGGIGNRAILGEKLANEPTLPRSHRHFTSGGLKQKNLHIKNIEPSALERWLQRDKGLWVDPPGKNAKFLFDIFQKYTIKYKADDQQTSKFSIFPRSERFETEYIVAMERAGQLKQEERLGYYEAYVRLPCALPSTDTLPTSRNKCTSVIGTPAMKGDWLAERATEGKDDRPCATQQNVALVSGTTEAGKGETDRNDKQPSPPSTNKLVTCICNKDKIFPPKQLEPCICRMKPLGVTGTVAYPMASKAGDVLAVGGSLCPLHRDNIITRGYCPMERGRPCPESSEMTACSPEKERQIQMEKLGRPFKTGASRCYNEKFPSEIHCCTDKSQKKAFPEFSISNL